jgi:hypothetical protein
VSGVTTAAVDAAIRRLSRDRLVAFVAALWRARGFEVTPEDADGALVVSRDGCRRRLVVRPAGDHSTLRYRLERLVTAVARTGSATREDPNAPRSADVPGSRIVVTDDGTDGRTESRPYSPRADRQFDETDLRRVLLYGIDRERARRLAADHLDVDLSAGVSRRPARSSPIEREGPTPRATPIHEPTRRKEARTDRGRSSRSRPALAVAVVVLVAAVAGAVGAGLEPATVAGVVESQTTGRASAPATPTVSTAVGASGAGQANESATQSTGRAETTGTATASPAPEGPSLFGPPDDTDGDGVVVVASVGDDVSGPVAASLATDPRRVDSRPVQRFPPGVDATGVTNATELAAAHRRSAAREPRALRFSARGVPPATLAGPNAPVAAPTRNASRDAALGRWASVTGRTVASNATAYQVQLAATWVPQTRSQEVSFDYEAYAAGTVERRRVAVGSGVAWVRYNRSPVPTGGAASDWTPVGWTGGWVEYAFDGNNVTVTPALTPAGDRRYLLTTEWVGIAPGVGAYRFGAWAVVAPDGLVSQFTVAREVGDPATVVRTRHFQFEPPGAGPTPPTWLSRTDAGNASAEG